MCTSISKCIVILTKKTPNLPLDIPTNQMQNYRTLRLGFLLNEPSIPNSSRTLCQRGNYYPTQFYRHKEYFMMLSYISQIESYNLPWHKDSIRNISLKNRKKSVLDTVFVPKGKGTM